MQNLSTSRRNIGQLSRKALERGVESQGLCEEFVVEDAVSTGGESRWEANEGSVRAAETLGDYSREG